MSQLGCHRVTVAVRSKAKGERFAAEMSRIFPVMRFDATGIEGPDLPEADLIFNATPMGSRGVPVSVALKRVIYGHATVFDAVYRPMKTELLKVAEEKGALIIYGYEMLLNQGTMAFENLDGKTGSEGSDGRGPAGISGGSGLRGRGSTFGAVSIVNAIAGGKGVTASTKLGTESIVELEKKPGEWSFFLKRQTGRLSDWPGRRSGSR